MGKLRGLFCSCILASWVSDTRDKLERKVLYSFYKALKAFAAGEEKGAALRRLLGSETTLDEPSAEMKSDGQVARRLWLYETVCD